MCLNAKWNLYEYTNKIINKEKTQRQSRYYVTVFEKKC